MPKPIIILIEPQLPENVGAVARAMGNFSLSELRLVSPLCDPTDPKAIATSAGAEEILISSQIFPDFEEAVADLSNIVGTCADHRHMIKPLWPLRHGVDEIGKIQGRTGVIFGPERTGLSNDHLARCQAIIQIPTNPNFSSLNLAQAVLLFAYELYQNHGQSAPILHTGETRVASQAQLHQWLKHLEETLDQVNFWRVASKKPIMWRNLMNIFTRTPLTEQEIRTLYGVIDILIHPRTEKDAKQLEKAK